jgi:hypothetical protein
VTRAVGVTLHSRYPPLTVLSLKKLGPPQGSVLWMAKLRDVGAVSVVTSVGTKVILKWCWFCSLVNLSPSGLQIVLTQGLLYRTI